MAKTLTSNNIPEHSTLHDIAPDASWLDGYSVESLDAFIKANAGEDVRYGLEEGKMYSWLLVKQTPRNAYVAADGTPKPARLVLTWREVRSGFEGTSNVYMTPDGIEDWLAKAVRRTNYHINDAAPKGHKLGLLDALSWLSTHPIDLAWDYINGSSRPYVSFKWISDGNKVEHGRNEIPG